VEWSNVKVNHRITGRTDDPFWPEIDRLGLDYEHGDPNNVLGFAISVLNVTEDDPRWPEVERLVVKYNHEVHGVGLLYTKAETDGSEWLHLDALGHHGYPQPEDDFGYHQATYDVSNFCPICSIGGVQNAPFRLRAEPKASHSQFIQLNWLFDEFFVRSEARDGLTASGLTGIEFRPAVLHTKNWPSAQVEQLYVRKILPPALDASGLAPVTCKPQNEEWRPGLRLMAAERAGVPYCGRVKYHLKRRTPLRFDRHAFAGAPDVVKSHEWFGSGGEAFRLVLVSQRFRQVVLNAKWRGLHFEPIELSGTPT
jgi:hypothetical protein